MICPQFQNRQMAAGEILLIAQILIADGEQIETARFSRFKQLSVFEAAPAHFHSCLNFVIW